MARGSKQAACDAGPNGPDPLEDPDPLLAAAKTAVAGLSPRRAAEALLRERVAGELAKGVSRAKLARQGWSRFLPPEAPGRPPIELRQDPIPASPLPIAQPVRRVS